MSLFSRSTEGERINLRSKARSYLDSGMSHLAEAFSTASSRKLDEETDHHERLYDEALDWVSTAQDVCREAVEWLTQAEHDLKTAEAYLEFVQQRHDELFEEAIDHEVLESEITLKEEVDQIWETIQPDPRNWVEALFPSEETLDRMCEEIPTFTTEQDRDIYSPAEEFDPQFAHTFDQESIQALSDLSQSFSQKRMVTAPLSPMPFVNPNRIGY